MKCIRKPLTPVDAMFQQPPLAYTPGSLAKTPDPPVLSRDKTEPEPPSSAETIQPRPSEPNPTECSHSEQAPHKS